MESKKLLISDMLKCEEKKETMYGFAEHLGMLTNLWMPEL